MYNYCWFTGLSDFVGITSQPVVFSSGDNFKSVFVNITNDDAFEETEEFKGAIALGDSQDIAEITVPEAIVTIIDDDEGMLKFLIFSSHINPSPTISVGALKLFSGTIYQTQTNTQQK